MHHHTSHHGEDGGSSTSLPDYYSLDGELDTISSQPRKTYSIERFSLLQLALYVPIMKNLFPTCSRTALLLELFGSESWLPASFLSMEPWTGYHLLSSRTNFQRRQSKVLRWLLMAETIWKQRNYCVSIVSLPPLTVSSGGSFLPLILMPKTLACPINRSLHMHTLHLYRLYPHSLHIMSVQWILVLIVVRMLFTGLLSLAPCITYHLSSLKGQGTQ